MLHRFAFCYLITTIILGFVSISPSSAQGNLKPFVVDSPYDLVNAVNALRASNGLPPYGINSILMYTAQSHAEFMAATGNVSHTGAGGSSVTDRLLAAGYPLAGDLSLGGFRSENITAGSEGSSSAQSAVNSWTGDAPHLATMLSPNLTEIGAGIAVSNGRVYYVIDCARPTTDGVPQSSSPSAGSGSAVPAGGALIPPVTINTPNSAGDVIHEVLSGQTLWQIAIAYNVKIDEIKALNALVTNDIFPGEKLLIRKQVITPTISPSPTETATVIVAPTTTFIATHMALTATATPVNFSSSNASSNQTTMRAVMGLIALALLSGGIFSWLGNSREE